MPLVIDLKVARAEKQIERLNKSVEKLRDTFKEIAEIVRTMADDTDRAGRSFRRSVGGGRGGGGGGRAGGGAPPAARFTRGPAQRLMDLQQQRANLPFISDPAQRQAVSQDIQRAEFLARRSIVLQARRNANPKALGGPGLLELFTDLNAKIGGLGGAGGAGGASRGVGGLIASLKGVGGKLGIVGAAITLLVGAVVAWISVVKKAASLGANIGRQASLTGGRLGNVTASLGAAQFLGTDVASLAGAAAAAGEGGGLAGATQAGFGISPVPFKFGGPDEGTRLRRLIEVAMDTTRGQRERQMLLERAGAGQLRPLTQLDAGQAERLQGLFDRLADPELVKRSNDFKIALIGLGAAFQELLVTDLVISSMRAISLNLMVFSKMLTMVGDAFDHPIIKALIGITPVGSALRFFEMFEQQREMSEKEIANRTKFVDGLDKHRRMMREHGEALGGDVRARRALPPGAAENLIYGGRDVAREIALGLL